MDKFIGFDVDHKHTLACVTQAGPIATGSCGPRWASFGSGVGHGASTQACHVEWCTSVIPCLK